METRPVAQRSYRSDARGSAVRRCEYRRPRGGSVLKCDDLTVRYSEDVKSTSVLDRITWCSPAPVTAVMGPSGSGKSTFLRVLSGLQAPSSGSVKLDGSPVSARSRGVVDPRIGVVYQDLRLVDFLSVEENLRLAADLRGVEVVDGSVHDALSAVGVAALVNRRPGQISGGEQQRVAIARAMLLRSAAVLADEPTGSLDAANTRAVAEVLVDMGHGVHDHPGAGAGERAGTTVVIATHDQRVADMADAVFYLESGRLRRER